MVKHNFRIGTTSYIYPDTLIANVRKLRDKVDDIELLLFEVDEEDNYPSSSELKELKETKKDCDLSYTVHMPLDISLGSRTGSKRKRSIDKTMLVMDRLTVLEAYCYVLHLNLSKEAEKNIKTWQGRVNDSLQHILKKTGTLGTEIAIENLDYPFSYVEGVIEDNNLSICIDIGHLITACVDVEKHLSRYLNRTKVIHFHGVSRGKDHESLKYLDKKFVESVLQFLKASNYQGILTLEIFSQSDFEESMNVLSKHI